MSKLASFFVGALVASLIAVVAMSFFVSTEAAASVSAPVASQSTPLELDQSGLPKGSLVWYLDGATCIAVPGLGFTCFCCEAEECTEREEPECEDCAPCTVSDTYTSTSTSGAYTSTVEVPASSDDAPSVSASSDGSNGSEEPPAVVFVDDDDDASDDTPSTGEPEPPAVVKDDNPNAGPKGNNGLGNGLDPAPPGIAKQGKPQNDDPAVPGDPQYKGKGSDGEPNGKSDEAPGQSKDKGKK